MKKSKMSTFEKEDPHLEICGREETTKTEVCKGGAQKKTRRITDLTNNVLNSVDNLFYLADWW